jgi:hypothetical protein
MLAYNCSPSFNWKKHLDDATIAKFQRELGAMGYKFQFVTLAGFHTLNHAMFELARGYKDRGMAAYSSCSRRSSPRREHGYTATRHQREVGTGYFDAARSRTPADAAPTTGRAMGTAFGASALDRRRLGALSLAPLPSHTFRARGRAASPAPTAAAPCCDRARRPAPRRRPPPPQTNPANPRAR